MKRIIALALFTMMSLSLFAGCNKDEVKGETSDKSVTDEKPDDDQEVVDPLNVGVFYYNFSDVYISSVRNSMDEELGTLGITPQNYDGATNQATQIDQINTAITNGTDLLIVNIVETSSPDAAQSAVDAAKAADIPIIFFNREVDDAVVQSYEKCAFVGTNAPEAGHMQGAMVGKYLLENYDAVDLNGDGVISYVMFKGQEGNAEAEARTQFGVEDANALLIADGKDPLSFYDSKNDAKYLVDQGGNWSAQAATDYMNNILAEYSESNGNMIELIIANNDGMAEGAISALQGAGYNTGDEKMIPVFGVDATDTAKQLINEDKMTGTIMQDAIGMAKTINTLVLNVQEGNDIMANTEGYNIDAGDTDKIRVPYSEYTKEAE